MNERGRIFAWVLISEAVCGSDPNSVELFPMLDGVLSYNMKALSTECTVSYLVNLSMHSVVIYPGERWSPRCVIQAGFSFPEKKGKNIFV